MGVLRLLGPDQSTLLFDFTAPTGTGNPSTVITKLGAELDLGTIVPSLDTDPRTYGVDLIGNSTSAVEMTVPFTASAASDDALWAGLGQLDRYLLSISRDHPLYLEWTELTSTLYYDVIGALSLVQLLRGQREAGIVAGRKSSLGMIPLRLLRQPWARGAAVTSSGVTVPNNPTTGTKGRVYPLTVTGDLPTPGRIRVQMDTGSTVERVLIAHRAQKSRSSSLFADGLSDTYWFDCEATNRNWTIALGTDTSSQANADASGGNAARVTHNTNGNIMQRRVSATRTTKLDSLRGQWTIWARVDAQSAGTFEVQARWGASTADPAAVSNAVVTHDALSATTFGFVELNLGTFQLPESVALAGVRIEIWTRDTLNGADDLDIDFVWLSPATHATAVIPGATSSTTLGDALTTPPYKLTADSTWIAGSVSGTGLVLNTNLEGGGLGPNAGVDYPDGTNTFHFDTFCTNFTGTAVFRVVSVGGGGAGAVIVSNTQALTAFSGSLDPTLTFVAAASTNYQAQVVLTAYSTGNIKVNEIAHFFTPSIANSESIRTEPGPSRYGVDRLDTAGNYAGSLSCEGEVPVLLEPGENHIFVRCDDARLVFYNENENILGRTPTVTVAYDPRFAI